MITIDDLEFIRFYNYTQALSRAQEYVIRCSYKGKHHFYSKKIYDSDKTYKNEQELKDELIEGLLEQLNRESTY